VASNCASMQHQASDENGSTPDAVSDRFRAPLHWEAQTGMNNVDPSTAQYYRIVFKGVVALLDAPQRNAPRNGSFLSYGEVFCASSELDGTCTTKVVKVQSILTGGYTLDTTNSGGSGYLFLEQNDIIIAEPLRSIRIHVETGTFHYQVISNTPVPILTGPSIDAPKTRAVVLPRSIQEVSVRIVIGNDMNADTCFLRLSHRRGWVADRKRAAKSHTFIMKEVTCDTSDVVSCDGSVATMSTVTSRSLSGRTRHRPPRTRRDASTKDVDKSMLNVRSHHVLAKHLLDASERSMAPSSNASMLSDDSSHTNQSISVAVAQHAFPASRDSSFSTSQGVTSLAAGGSNHVLVRNYYLMKVKAPRGLKILDAPQFQVNRLIHSGKQSQPSVMSSHMVTQLESHGPKLHHSIFRTMSGRLTTTGPSQSGNPAVFDSASKSRRLPHGVLFEASSRMEVTGSFSEGEGLIRLSDSSGWAIVPYPEELDQQYMNFSRGPSGINIGDSSSAFEEVGSAALETGKVSHPHQQSGRLGTTWLRIMARNGLAVSCPPPTLVENDDETSPTSSRGSSAINGSNHGSIADVFPSNESDVASSVGSSFLDAMFRTPKKKDTDIVKETGPRASLDRALQVNTIPCGMPLEVERWANESSGKEYARLCGGQGWVPLAIAGKPSAARIARPEFRHGSFWFRVQSPRGLKVRLGPSTRAPSIKSDEGVYFRFECGEFLRASEILTMFSDEGEPSESFVKLYRNRHARFHLGHDECRSLVFLTTQAEWVQAYCGSDLFLVECALEPRIERHKQGWRYNVLPEDGVAVRKGPSFASEKTGVILFGGESVVVNERVTPSGDTISWLRMKDGQGWIHDVDETGEHVVIAHSLRHRAQSTRPRKPNFQREGTDIAYNDIIARLFNNDDGYRPRKKGSS
jgi:hypothetical protein